MRRHVVLWQKCDGRRGLGSRKRYTTHEQIQREAHATRFLRVAESTLNTSLRANSNSSEAEAGILQAFAAFARAALDMDDAHLKLLVEGFPKLARGLARRARQFDSAIRPADIFQASRNMWTAGGLQVLLGRALELTPAIFAYSMLYPYTDNLLDDPGTPGDVKLAFNRRFRARLEGHPIDPADNREQQVFALVSQIESQYSRTQYPDVYRSLLAIQSAQEHSIGLRHEAGLQTDEVVSGVFRKGGTSVLADGFLAAGMLTPEQAEFAFGWGVLLQLGDDLQDVAEDLTSGASTLFSEAAGKQPLDLVTGRVFEFGTRVFAGLQAFHTPAVDPLKELIRRSAETLLITAAGVAHQLHTNAYIQSLEPHSPFRFGFIRDHREFFYGSGGLVGRCVAFL